MQQTIRPLRHHSHAPGTCPESGHTRTYGLCDALPLQAPFAPVSHQHGRGTGPAPQSRSRFRLPTSSRYDDNFRRNGHSGHEITGRWADNSHHQPRTAAEAERQQECITQRLLRHEPDPHDRGCVDGGYEFTGQPAWDAGAGYVAQT